MTNGSEQKKHQKVVKLPVKQTCFSRHLFLGTLWIRRENATKGTRI